MDLENNTSWEIENVNQEYASNVVFDDFTVEMTEKYLAVFLPIHGNVSRSLLRVWNIEKKEQIFEDVIERLIFTTVDGWKDPNYLVILSSNIQVINFKNENNIVNTNVNAEVGEFAYGSCYMPFILQIQFRITGIEAFKVWKYEDNFYKISI